jgi:exosortase
MSGILENRVASGAPDVQRRGRTFLPSQVTSYAFVAALLTSLIVFRAPLEHLLKFSDNSEYSYIPVIPFISAFLILARRNGIFRYAKPSPWIGGSVAGGGILLMLVSNVFGADSIDRIELFALGIVSVWWGLFLLCYGAQAARRAMLPLALLLFMIPAPGSVMNAVIGFLREGSAALSYYLFRAIGVPAVREGMVISLPRLTIEVAPECSGIRSSISLLIVVLAGANLYLRSGWNKVLLVLTLVPLVIVKNAIRIVTLSTLALYVNPSFLNGRLHHQGGILFFSIAAVSLIPIVVVMRRNERQAVSH